MSLSAAPLPASIVQAPNLRILIIEGEDAVNILQQKTAVAPVVEVRDRNDLPVAGAAVTFSISGGKNAVFAGGLQQVTVVTNAAGRAVVTGLNPLSSGPLQIAVTASYEGQAAAITITQTNVLSAAQALPAANAAGASGGSGGGVSTTTAVGLVGAAAGVVGALALGGDEAPVPSLPNLSVAVSPTSVGIREVTTFTFTASGGSRPSPTYNWEFGEGGTATGASVTRTYSSEGTFTVRATVAGAQDSTTASVTVGSLTGTWVQRNSPGSTYRLFIAQNGFSLSGRWTQTCTGDPRCNPSDVPLSGSISNTSTLSISQDGECLHLLTGATLDGQLRVLTAPFTIRNPACAPPTGTHVFDRQ